MRHIRLPRRGRIRAILFVLTALGFAYTMWTVTERRDAVLREIQFCAQALVGDDPRYSLREAWVLCAQESAPEEGKPE